MIIRLSVPGTVGLTPDDLLARVSEITHCPTTMTEGGKHFHTKEGIFELSVDNDAEPWRDDAIVADLIRAFTSVTLVKRSPRPKPAPIPEHMLFRPERAYRHRAV